MTIDDYNSYIAKRLEKRIEKVYNGEEKVTCELISDLRILLLDKDGEINKKGAAILKDNTSLKIVPREVNTIDGPKKVFGVQYKEIGIEVGPIK